MNATACSYDDSLAFVRRYPRSLAALARQYGEEVNDLKQDLHIFYATWMTSYDKEKGAISTFIFSKLRWHLQGRRRAEFRHLTVELADETEEVEDLARLNGGEDLYNKSLPAGLPTLVLDTLEACRGGTCTADLARRLGITERGARKRLARAIELAQAALAAPQQGDLFGFGKAA